MTRRIVSAQPLKFFFTTTMSAMGVPLLLCLRSLLRAILAKTGSLFCQFCIFVELAQHAPQRMEYSGGPRRVVAGHLWTATSIDEVATSEARPPEAVVHRHPRRKCRTRGGLQPRSLRSLPPRSFASRRRLPVLDPTTPKKGPHWKPR